VIKTYNFSFGNESAKRQLLDKKATLSADKQNANKSHSTSNAHNFDIRQTETTHPIFILRKQTQDARDQQARPIFHIRPAKPKTSVFDRQDRQKDNTQQTKHWFSYPTSKIQNFHSPQTQHKQIMLDGQKQKKQSANKAHFIRQARNI
jgi:hypothetical protein